MKMAIAYDNDLVNLKKVYVLFKEYDVHENE